MNTQNSEPNNGLRISVRELVIFGMLGAFIFCTKLIMASLPNIHLVGMLTMVITLVYGKKALIPIYIYVLLEGFYCGFNVLWIPYIYVWAILWGVTMLLPKNMKAFPGTVIYAAVCCIHGLLYGTLFAPVYALIMKMSFEAAAAWVVAGLPFDFIHGIGNFVFGLFIIPVARLIRKISVF